MSLRDTELRCESEKYREAYTLPFLAGLNHNNVRDPIGSDAQRVTRHTPGATVQPLPDLVFDAIRDAGASMLDMHATDPLLHHEAAVRIETDQLAKLMTLYHSKGVALPVHVCASIITEAERLGFERSLHAAANTVEQVSVSKGQLHRFASGFAPKKLMLWSHTILYGLIDPLMQRLYGMQIDKRWSDPYDTVGLKIACNDLLLHIQVRRHESAPRRRVEWHRYPRRRDSVRVRNCAE